MARSCRVDRIRGMRCPDGGSRRLRSGRARSPRVAVGAEGDPGGRRGADLGGVGVRGVPPGDGLRRGPGALQGRAVAAREPGAARGLRLPHEADGESTGAAGVPGAGADAGPLAGRPRDDGPLLPFGLRGRLDVPVPDGSPPVPAAVRRADRRGPLRDVRLAGLLHRGAQAILVRSVADPGRALAGGRPVPAASTASGSPDAPAHRR